mmetsp:Transcript_92291/g.266362  ORF Transcript_92291/g.266362 Transcript_92291/m.266362 type:complete len:242 (-) Transcript_92291:962-1687(-)
MLDRAADITDLLPLHAGHAQGPHHTAQQLGPGQTSFWIRRPELKPSLQAVARQRRRVATGLQASKLPKVVDNPLQQPAFRQERRFADPLLGPPRPPNDDIGAPLLPPTLLRRVALQGALSRDALPGAAADAQGPSEALRVQGQHSLQRLYHLVPFQAAVARDVRKAEPPPRGVLYAWQGSGGAAERGAGPANGATRTEALCASVAEVVGAQPPAGVHPQQDARLRAVQWLVAHWALDGALC